MKFRTTLTGFALIGTFLAAPPGRADVDLMGYINSDYAIDNLSQMDGGRFQQTQLAFLLQHDWPGLKFFSEVEFQNAPELVDARDGRGANGFGAVAVERAWTEVTVLESALKIKVGKDFEPTLWQLYHYPNLRVSVSTPQMIGQFFKESFVGLLFTGEPLQGFHYDFWTMRGDPLVAQNAQGHSEVVAPARNGLSGATKIGYRVRGAAGFLDFSVLAAHYADAETSNPKGLDLDFSWNQVRLWSEFAVGGGATGYFALLSYTFPIGRKELIPYFLFDGLKPGSATTTRYRYIPGLTLKPRPEVAIKAEFPRTQAGEGQPGETGFQAALALFFD